MNEERLEALLSVYRYRGAMPDFRAVERRRPRRRAPFLWLAAAAVIVIAIGIAILPRPQGWTTGLIPRAMKPGDVINSESRIRSREVGVIDVGKQTTLRFIGKNRFELKEGTIHARTTSPPGVFVVETPRANAIDLGCEYTLTVAPNGTGILRVKLGWVGLNNWGQSLVPQGAYATIGSDGRLSPPIFEDASQAFQEAIRRRDLNTALPLARRRDALTLINLFRFATPEERRMVFERLNALVPAPPGVSPDWVEPWWPEVMKASGVTAIKKKKRMLPPT
jgi:hypothetical protein